MTSRYRNRTRLAAAGLLLGLLVAGAPVLLTGCPTAATADNDRPPKAEKWYRRAQQEFRVADVDAAHDSIQQALDIVPADEQVRLLAARVALARLEYAEVVRLLRDAQSAEALALLGRAYWYDGKLDEAAEKFQAMLTDPDVVDPWAKAVTKLALEGSGRRPFEISGGLLAQVDLPRLGPNVPFFVVPLEIDGDAALAMVSTGNAEVVLDSATRREPSWISLRFGKRLEVSDVPALTQDLSGLSGQLGAPIKALLGSNLLRHLNVTLDHPGRQFVARSFVPPPPPVASRIDLFYLRGGGMLMGANLGRDEGARAALFIDSAATHPVTLDRGGWKKLGIDVATLPIDPSDPQKKLRAGSIPLLRFGVFELPQVAAVYGVPFERMEQELNIDVDGVVGAGLLSKFRLTLSDGGRVLWVEQNIAVPARRRGGQPPDAPAGVGTGATTPPAVPPTVGPAPLGTGGGMDLQRPAPSPSPPPQPPEPGP